MTETDSMLRANVHKPYFRKFLFVAIGCFAFSAWFLYDGVIGYPAQLTIAEAFEALPEEDRSDAWETLATEKGWPTVTPQKTVEELRHDISGQFFWATLCAVLGVPMLLKWMSGQGTWVEGDESTLRNSRGQEVPIQAITKIDKRKWSEKGIAKIHYDVDGKTKKFVMDDFKYHRESMGELMLLAEANLTADQVIGDSLERDKEREEEEDEYYDDEQYDDEQYEDDGEYEDDGDELADEENR